MYIRTEKKIYVRKTSDRVWIKEQQKFKPLNEAPDTLQVYEFNLIL